MPVVRPHPPEALAAARRVLAEADVRHWRDIDVHAIAAQQRAYVRYVPLRTARACIMRTNDIAIIDVDETLRGTPREDFTVAHEVGHKVMHRQIDHFQQCEGEERKQGDYDIEREASAFAAELLMPTEYVAPMCTSPRPTLDDIARIARRGVSFLAASFRFVELSTSACAFALFAVDRRGAWTVQHGPQTASFPGRVVLRRLAHPKSMAAQLIASGSRKDPGPREVPAEAWAGLAKGRVLARGARPFVEHAVRFGPTVFAWIVPAE